MHELSLVALAVLIRVAWAFGDRGRAWLRRSEFFWPCMIELVAKTKGYDLGGFLRNECSRNACRTRLGEILAGGIVDSATLDAARAVAVRDGRILFDDPQAKWAVDVCLRHALAKHFLEEGIPEPFTEAAYLRGMVGLYRRVNAAQPKTEALDAGPSAMDRLPRIWELLSFTLGKRTRERVWEPACEELLERCAEARRYDGKWEKRYLAIVFSLRTIWLLLQCMKEGLGAATWGLVLEEIRKYLGL